MRKRTKLGSALSVNSGTGPVIGPCNITVFAQSNHGLNRKGHARLAFANRLVLGVVRNVGRAVEELVDTVTTVRANDTAVLGFGVLLNNVTEFTNESTGLNSLNSLVETLASAFNYANVIRVGLGAIANVVRLVKIGMVAVVVQSDVDVENVTVEQNSLIGNAVANDFVDGCTARLGEVVVVQRRWVRLASVRNG